MVPVGVDVNASAVPVDYLFGDPQSESCADVLLGGEEGFKDSIDVVGMNARAVVFDDDVNTSAVEDFDAGEFDSNGSVVADGVGGVGDEIGQGLFELAFEALNGRALTEAALDGDVLDPELVGIKPEDGLDYSRDIDGAGNVGL
jgi:hypothetical protein